MAPRVSKRKTADVENESMGAEKQSKTATRAPRTTAKPKAAESESAPTKSKPATKTKATAKSKITISKSDDQREKTPELADSRENDALPSIEVREENEETDRPAKKVRTVDSKKHPETLPRLTSPSKQRLNVYAFGTGENSELGLGPVAKIVKRPRLNTYLLPETLGVVKIVAGGMHALALTHDGRVYSWGVNDLGALGRSTKTEEKLRDMDAESSDSDDEVLLNEKESTPGEVSFPDGTVITRIAAADSMSVAVTDTGIVYGWGTFRCSDGMVGFSGSNLEYQDQPMIIEGLHNIVEVVCGADHVLALNGEGNCFAWGSGEQYQLGRRVIERTRTNALTPRGIGLPRRKVKYIGAGSYHSFAITKDGKVWAWGLNGYGQTGVWDDRHLDETRQFVTGPVEIESLRDKKIVQVTGGGHHSAAVSEDGKVYMWGRLDSGQLGIDQSKIEEENIARDEHGRARSLKIPMLVSEERFAKIECGNSHNIALHKDDRSVWSWGFGEMYQTGQGPPARDTPTPTKIENTAIRGVAITELAAGAQFSVIGGIPPATNGVNGDHKE